MTWKPKFTPTDDPRTFDMSLTNEGDIIGPRLDLDDISGERPRIIQGGYSGTEIRLEAARYFLGLLEKHITSTVAVMFHFDAFVTACRSVTFVLQKECKSCPGFSDWYHKQELRLADNPRARMFLELRNESEHEGPIPVILDLVFESRKNLKGELSFHDRVGLRFIGERKVEDVLTDSHDHFKFLEEIVKEAKRLKFFEKVDRSPIVRFTVQTLRESPKDGWVRYASPNWQPSPDEFPSKREYDQWRRTMATG